jgi:hypothetical protein
MIVSYKTFSKVKKKYIKNKLIMLLSILYMIKNNKLYYMGNEDLINPQSLLYN